jgi:hypothetical protein
MPNPLISQGTLSRVRPSVVWNNFSTLNITAPYLGKGGIKFTPQGEAVQYFPTMTGAVTSMEPYMMCEVIAVLLKSQALANTYKNQMETNSLLGDGTVRPDATPLAPYSVVNCSIKTFHELDFSGQGPDFVIVFGGYYLINSSLFQ